MSDLGYSNQNQSRINISLNSLDEYVRDLSNAICTTEPSYEDIGVKVDGRTSWRPVFNAFAPTLPGFARETAFTF